MKTNKEGKIKLEPGEYRSGNFVYKREGTHVISSQCRKTTQLSSDIEER
jgi:hypothetical protein